MFVWVLTIFSNDDVKMYEFDTEKEAREAFRSAKGEKILSEIIYFNDPVLA